MQAIENRRVGEFRRFIRVMFGRRLVIFGTAMVLVLILTAILAPVLSPYDPNEPNMKAVLKMPSREHLLGTDELGRDFLSRVIYGSRVSLMVGIVAVIIAAGIGVGLGLISGFYGGWTDIIIMRCIDALLALPPLVLMMAISAVLGGGLRNVLVAIGITMMPTYARLMRGQVITLKENDYVTAAYALGAKGGHIMLRHLLPNCFPPLLVLVTINLGTAILMEAALSFIGIGISPPMPAWGAMIASGYKYLIPQPIISIAPGVAVLLVVLGFNVVGDGVRDALDPRLRGRL